MSLSDWTSWNDRKDRPRERIREELPPPAEPMLAEPMEVEEDVLSQTGVMRFLQRIVARRP